MPSDDNAKSKGMMMKQRSITFSKTYADAACDWCRTHIGARRGIWGDIPDGWGDTPDGKWTHRCNLDETSVFTFYDVDDKILVDFKLRFG